MAKRKFKGHTPGKTKTSDRFPCGKPKPKPVEPNPRILAAREVLGLPANATVSAIGYSYRRGWIAQRDLITAETYAEAYRGAALGTPGAAVTKDDGLATGAAALLQRDWHEMTDAQVLALRWQELSRKEIAAIWDSAFRPAPATQDRKGALRRWRLMAKAALPAELAQIDRVVLQDGWPAWIVERAQGRSDTPHERERDLLLSGLSKMRAAIWAAKSAPAANDDHGNDNEVDQAHTRAE